MLEIVASHHARELTADLARSALPDSPIEPEPLVAARSTTAAPLRQRASVLLRRLADLVEPAPSREGAMADRR